MTADLICEVQLWGKRVGALAEDDGLISFQYDPVFINTRLEISPFEMPLANRIYTHHDRNPAFQGLIGVFADSLPDKFGNAIIEQYFRHKTRTTHVALSPVQKLLYIGQHATGALEYLPPEKDVNDKIKTSLEISRLVKEARQVIQGDLHVKSASIIQVGVSAGGQYPKAVIAWNPETNDVISGIGHCPTGYQHWIIKFDGAQGNPEEFGKLEYAYSLMAKASGIDMAPTYLLEENGRHHFMVKRFDRLGNNEKLHMASLCGLLHKDYNIPRLIDYEDFMRATLAITNSQLELQKAFHRMVFNVLARNQDDHTKNFAYLMDNNGRWRLSPAFDLTFAFGNNFTARHQMSINGKDDNINKNDLLELADRLSINNASEVITKTQDAINQWDTFAQQAKLNKEFQRYIGENHRTL